MAIIRASIGDQLKEFDDGSTLDEVWEFVHSHIANSDDDKGIVQMDDGGGTIGEIWHRSQFFALWGTPAIMRSYLQLIGFDQEDRHQ